MLLLLLSLVSFAQEEPQTFEAVPADVEVDGNLLRGILIDEATYARLVALETDVEELEQDVQTFEEWRASQAEVFTLSLDAVKTSCSEGQAKLSEHYESQLKREKRKDAFQRHGFPIGVGVGVVVSAALTILVVNAYDRTLPDGIVGN